MDRRMRSKTHAEVVEDSLERHTQCDRDVPLLCQQELYTQGFLDVPTGRKPEDSNLESVETMH
jgi:hypothetical protein